MTPPSQNDLLRIYYELGKMGARTVGEKKSWSYSPQGAEEIFALAAEWSRFDPRLLQIVVEFGRHHWKNLSPQKLREAMQNMQTPQTIGVAASFIMTATEWETELSLFWNYITAGLKPLAPQFYFYNLHMPGSKLAQRAALESLDEFLRWGFLGRERVIVDQKTKRSVGTWGQTSRRNILKRLFQKKRRLQISDYLEALHHSISRQQALLDLKKLPAKPEGEGRSACWSLPGSQTASPTW